MQRWTMQYEMQQAVALGKRAFCNENLIIKFPPQPSVQFEFLSHGAQSTVAVEDQNLIVQSNGSMIQWQSPSPVALTTSLFCSYAFLALSPRNLVVLSANISVLCSASKKNWATAPVIFLPVSRSTRNCAAGPMRRHADFPRACPEPLRVPTKTIIHGLLGPRYRKCCAECHPPKSPS